MDVTGTKYSGIRNAGAKLVAAGILCVIGAVTATARSGSVTGLDPAHTRYSPLAQITAKNAGDLKPVWVYDTGTKGRGWQVSPIVVDNVMYISLPGGAAALDPETGKQALEVHPFRLVQTGTRSRGRLLAGRWRGRSPHHLHRH